MESVIVTFEDLLQTLVNNFETQQQVHWVDGDLINRYFRNPKHSREIPAGKIAEHLQCTRQYVWHLCSTAAFWPPECREAFADHTWSWFKEVKRMPDAKTLEPMTLGEKYAGYSLRELKDARGGKPRTDRERIVITLMEDKLEELDRAQVMTTARLKDGTQLEVWLKKIDVAEEGGLSRLPT